MPLWEVDVAGVSHRFVEAESAAAAVEQVRDALAASFHLRATKASAHLATTYEEAGPLVRKRILAAMDGLSSPRRTRDARREYEKLGEWIERSDAWVREELSSAPPVDPRALDKLLALQEVAHVDRNMLRLKDWERTSTHHHG